MLLFMFVLVTKVFVFSQIQVITVILNLKQELYTVLQTNLNKSILSVQNVKMCYFNLIACL